MSDEGPSIRHIGAVERVSERFYTGLWSILVRWMRVPQDPPNLPASPGDEVIAIHPSHGFLRYLKLWFWIAAVSIDLVLLVLWIVLLVAVPWLGIVLAPLWWGVMLVPDIVAYIAIHLRYDTTWYVLSPRSMRLRRGIWTIKEITLTYENIQNVRVSQGPVERYYGIAKLQVETAGAGAAGPHGTSVANVGIVEGIDNAEELRDMLMARVRASRSTGLGDELHEHEGHRHAGEMWTQAHVDALRQIRDLVVAAQ
ncbi:MAG: PH domain-containing protein [Phycisphaerales bacterium]|nr:PH domain-containing protein [Phycisphaerales bacterium]